MKTNPFDQCSEAYSRFRPDYPPELHQYLIERCGLNGNSRVLDVGAGTGKGSAPLAARGIPTISSELSPAMIGQGVKSYPGLQFICATAEELPLRDRSFRLVSSAQAFHWFEHDKMVAEVSRVLGPAAYFVVYWNSRDLEVDHIREFEQLVAKFNPAHVNSYRRRAWGSIIERTGLFIIIDEPQFHQTVAMSAEDWVGLAHSISYIRVIGSAKVAEFERALREMLARHGNLDCSYTTWVWLAQKTGNGSPRK